MAKRYDEDDVLQDGAKRTVPMMLRDSTGRETGEIVQVEPWQRDTIWAARFGLNDAADLFRNGSRHCTDAAARAHVEEVYQDEKRKLQDAWRQPVADARPGDVPRRQDSSPHTMDAATAQRIRDEAWLTSVKDLEDAWKKPLP